MGGGMIISSQALLRQALGLVWGMLLFHLASSQSDLFMERDHPEADQVTRSVLAATPKPTVRKINKKQLKANLTGNN